jgi:hypothetical protein
MLKRIILVAAIATCLSANAYAETNREIYKSCTTDDVDPKNYDTFCVPYVKAIVRTLYPLSKLSGCIPFRTSLADIEMNLIMHIFNVFNAREEWGLNFIQLYDSMTSELWECPSIYEVHREAAAIKNLKNQKNGANDGKKSSKLEDLMKMPVD